MNRLTLRRILLILSGLFLIPVLCAVVVMLTQNFAGCEPNPWAGYTCAPWFAWVTAAGIAAPLSGMAALICILGALAIRKTGSN